MSLFRSNHLLQVRKGQIQNVAIQEDDSIERLVLSRRRDPPPGGEVGEKLYDLFSSHALRMPEIMKFDESDDPADVSLLGAAAVVSEPNRRPDAVEEFGSRHAGKGLGWQ
jgi:hypothetical protein